MAQSKHDICSLCGLRFIAGYNSVSTPHKFCSNCWTFSQAICQALIRAALLANHPVNQPQYQNISYSHSYSGGDSEMAEIRFSNGDTEDWTKVQLIGLGKRDFDQILGFIKLTMPSNARNWDAKRAAWFVKTELIDILIRGLTIFIQGLDSPFLSIKITDKREKYESFEEFFNTPPPIAGKAPRSKNELLKALEQLLKTNNIFVSLREDIDLNTCKKYYRQAALVFHPDRNNGDGTKMGELNVIWNDLKEKF